MELRIAILGGVIPGVLVAVAMAVGALVARMGRRSQPGTGTVDGERAERQRPTDQKGDQASQRDKPADAPLDGTRETEPRAPSAAWLLGVIPALALIHFASWSWPEFWPTSATQRLIHSGLALVAWGLVEVVVPRRTPRWARALGRLVVVAAVVGVLAHAFLGALGWGRVIGLATGAAALTALATSASIAGARRWHPSLPMASLFVAAIGAIAVLLIGRTATGAQASAGVAALAAATGVAALLFRKAAPVGVGPFVLTGTMCWVLAMGGCSSAHVNWVAIAILPLAPAAWGLPLDRLPVVRSRAWLRPLPAATWTLAGVGAAVLVAWLNRPPSFNDYPY